VSSNGLKMIHSPALEHQGQPPPKITIKVSLMLSSEPFNQLLGFLPLSNVTVGQTHALSLYSFSFFPPPHNPWFDRFIPGNFSFISNGFAPMVVPVLLIPLPHPPSHSDATSYEVAWLSFLLYKVSIDGKNAPVATFSFQ